MSLLPFPGLEGRIRGGNTLVIIVAGVRARVADVGDVSGDVHLCDGYRQRVCTLRQVWMTGDGE